MPLHHTFCCMQLTNQRTSVCPDATALRVDAILARRGRVIFPPFRRYLTAMDFPQRKHASPLTPVASVTRPGSGGGEEHRIRILQQHTAGCSNSQPSLGMHPALQQGSKVLFEKPNNKTVLLFSDSTSIKSRCPVRIVPTVFIEAV